MEGVMIFEVVMVYEGWLVVSPRRRHRRHSSRLPDRRLDQSCHRFSRPHSRNLCFVHSLVCHHLHIALVWLVLVAGCCGGEFLLLLRRSQPRMFRCD